MNQAESNYVSSNTEKARVNLLCQESQAKERWHILEYPKEVLYLLIPENFKDQNLEVIPNIIDEKKRMGDIFMAGKASENTDLDAESAEFLEYNRFADFVFKERLKGKIIEKQKLFVLWSLRVMSRKAVMVDWFELRKEIQGKGLSKIFYESLYPLLQAHQFKAVLAKPEIVLNPKLKDFHLETLEMKPLSDLSAREIEDLIGYEPDISELMMLMFRRID